MKEFLLDWLTRPLVLVFLGGGAGSCLRYTIGRWVASFPGAQGFPWGTLLVNVVGSFLLAGCLVLCIERAEENYHKTFLLLGSGFCGGFTTFSTFTNETLSLHLESHPKWALLYVSVSLLAGIGGGVLGWLFFHWIAR